MYIKEGSLLKVSEKTQYSFKYLKQVSSKKKWKEKKKLRGINDTGKVCEILKIVNGQLVRVTEQPILHIEAKKKRDSVERWDLGSEQVVIDNTETDAEGNVKIGKSEAKFMKEKISEREQLIEAQKKKKVIKKSPEKVPQDPVEAAINRVMEITGADGRFREQARYEISRWTSKYYSLEEAISKACLTISAANESLRNEKKKISEDKGNVSDRMWSKLWGKVGKIRY
jgi:hypothetical protein